MPRYHYIAADASGRLRRGAIDADGRGEFLENLARLRRHCLLYRVDKRKKTIQSRCIIKNKQLVLFCQKLHVMLSCGVRIDEALAILEDSVRDRRIRRSICLLRADIEEGELLSQAMRRQNKNYPPVLIHAVEAGEEGGLLGECMAYMSDYFKRGKKLRDSVVTAAIYPVILLALCVVIVFLLFAFFLPSMKPMFAGTQLPPVTQKLFAVSEFFQANGRTVLGVAAIAVLAVIGLFQEKKIRRLWDKILIRTPFVGTLARTIYTARFSQAMTVLRRSRVPIDEALEMAGDALNNRYLSEKMREARRRVSDGSRLYEALKSADVFDALFPSMVITGEEGSSLDRVFELCSDYYGDSLDTLIKKGIALMEPVFILILGVLVGVVVISIMLPMYDMMSAVLP